MIMDNALHTFPWKQSFWDGALLVAGQAMSVFGLDDDRLPAQIPNLDPDTK